MMKKIFKQNINKIIIIAVWLFKNRKFFVKRSLWIAGFIGMAIIAILGLPLLKELLKDTKYRSYIKLDFSVSSLLGTVFIIAFAVLCMLFYYKIIQSSRYEKIAVPFITSLAFLVMYPMTFLMGAYRIPRYYAMPRLAVWSEMVVIDKKISHLKPQQNFIIYRVLLQFILLLYMLFLLTRWASNGCFAYECIFFS